MDDKLKEALFIACAEASNKHNVLLDSTNFGEDIPAERCKELHDTFVAYSTLFDVIKQAGALRDYSMWPVHRSAANKDKDNERS